MPPKRSTPKILHCAWELRTLALGASAKEEPTSAEAKLWLYLRLLREDGIHFCKQHAIGPYNTDFSPKGTLCTPRKKLIVELDGSEHVE